MLRNQQPFVIGIGAAIVDYIAPTTPDTLCRHGLRTGGMTLVSAQQMDHLVEETNPTRTSAGGAVSNTMVTLARLGTPTWMLGATADDAFGALYRTTLQQFGIGTPAPSRGDLPTSRVWVGVTSDGERSMAACLGASLHWRAEDMRAAPALPTSVVIEGYAWTSPHSAQEATKALQLAKSQGIQVVMTLPDAYHCSVLREQLLENAALADIVFANEAEYLALMDEDTLEPARTRAVAPLTFVTQSERGVWVFQQQESPWHHAEPPCTRPTDSTGAGDSFAAGALHQLLHGASIAEAASLGCRIARQMVETEGPHFDESLDLRVHFSVTN